MNTITYPRGVKTVLYINITLLAITLSALLILTLIKGIKILSEKIHYNAIIGMTVGIIEIYGIHKIKSWIIELVLFFAYFGVMNIILHPFTNFTECFATILGLMLFVFQIFVFSKNETKIFFKSKGDTLY